MMTLKLKKMTLPLIICITSALLMPALAQAELGGSGGTAARDAAAQREAKEKKLELKRQKAAEAQKAAESAQGQPADAQTPAVEPKVEPAPQ